jgi:hypothetical protein
MAPQVTHPFALQTCLKQLSTSSTYDHRTLKIELPVRSAVLKQCTGGLVVRWVTTGEYPLLYVFCSFLLPCDDVCRDGFSYCTVHGKGKGYVGWNVIEVPKGWDVPTSYCPLFYGASHTPLPFPDPSITSARLRSTWTQRHVVHSLARLGSTSSSLLVEWFSVKD